MNPSIHLVTYIHNGWPISQTKEKNMHHRSCFHNRSHLSVLHKKDYKKDIANYIPISHLNLDYKFILILTNQMKKTFTHYN